MNINVNRVKIIVTVPSDNIEEVRDALFAHGAGVIGNYPNCSSATKSIGTFKPTIDIIPLLDESFFLNN